MGRNLRIASKLSRGGGSDKDGDTQTNQHTPPAHSPPGDEGCYCFAACSIYKHPLPVPLPDHATQRTKSATKLQLIQMVYSNNDSDGTSMRRLFTPIKTHHLPSTGLAPNHRPRWHSCPRRGSSFCHYQHHQCPLVDEGSQN